MINISFSDSNLEDEILLQADLTLTLNPSLPSVNPTLLDKDLATTSVDRGKRSLCKFDPLEQESFFGPPPLAGMNSDGVKGSFS